MPLSTYFDSAPTSKDVWMGVARRAQYIRWPVHKLIKRIAKRESALFKCLPRNVLMTRKQRYANLSCALLIAAFLTCLLFRADCQHTPKAALCNSKKVSFLKSLFSWDVVFATIWGVQVNKNYEGTVHGDSQRSV